MTPVTTRLAPAYPAARRESGRSGARLPLALRVAAERAAASPDVSLADLTSELADQQERLDVLDVAGDRLTAVRAVFSWSVRHLDDEAARSFRLLGLHPGADFDAYAVAALAGSTLRQARWLLVRLARAHLIQPAGTRRYRMHDLLRAYAADQAADQHSEQERRAALTRLFDHYLATAAVAADTLFRARALAFLGISDLRRGRHRQAISHLQQSLSLHSQADDCSGQAEALNGLGEAFLAASQAGQASTQYAAALALAIQCGDKHEQARADRGQASAHQATGSSEQARVHWQARARSTGLGQPETGQAHAQTAR